jgi:hypothetical protein
MINILYNEISAYSVQSGFVEAERFVSTNVSTEYTRNTHFGIAWTQNTLNSLIHIMLQVLLDF